MPGYRRGQPECHIGRRAWSVVEGVELMREIGVNGFALAQAVKTVGCQAMPGQVAKQVPGECAA